MPLVSVQTYLKSLLNGLVMPYQIPDMVAYITPPDPNVEAEFPTAYIWPSTGDESRDAQKGGTVPRNTGPNTPSGFKNIEHNIDVWIVYFGQDDDVNADSAFPGIVDVVMYTLRTSPERPIVTDPLTGQQSALLDIGEKMSYRVELRALSDQAYNRYDALITVPIIEVMQA